MQKARSIAVSGPLGEDVLAFQRMAGMEEIGRPFQFDVDVISKDDAVKPEDVLGKGMTVSLELAEGEKRHFHGLVARFSQTGSSGNFASYRATLRPWLWFLTRTADCRIFQEKAVPDILDEVFREHGFTDVEQALSGSYRTWDYCVQYRETDFNFVSRLMEQEGIFYYFKHEEGKHTLVLGDSYSAHDPIPGYAQIPFVPPDSDVVDEREHVYSFDVSHEVQPGSYVLNDFDFERPKAKLEVKLSSPQDHAQSEFEVYDYPGEYVQTSDGDTYVQARLEEQHAQYTRAEGESNARGIAVGGLFELTEFPRDDQNIEYLVVSTVLDLRSDAYATGGGGGDGPIFRCSFVVADSQKPFRTKSQTAKPLIQGPQTAIVVGKSGEEIWTDKYGRVKVQFHWDRYGKSDENSSCWIRVAQVWAGKNWGAMHIPRMGQEVIVEFLEGDPDRPIITGRVYNGDQMPPYDLPANQTQSGVKSRSTKEGSGENFNEIRMEDKKGEEVLYFHAEKDQQIIVENDKAEDIGHDETITVGNDKSETIGNDESITIENDRTETVKNNETLTVENDRSRDVGNDESVSVGNNRSVSVAKDETKEVEKNKTLTVGENREATIGKNDTVTVEKVLKFEAGEKIVLTVGDATLTMESDGTVSLEGGDISLEGSGKINIKASSDVIIKGSKVTSN